MDRHMEDQRDTIILGHNTILSHHYYAGYKKSVSLFPIVKLAAYYAEIGRVGKLEEDFQIFNNFCLFKFYEIFTILFRKHQ